jgi:hypothetical protein
MAVAQNVGIGNNNPSFKLDVSGRIRLRAGNDLNNTSGIWLGSVGFPNINEGFMGMRNNEVMGFYGERGAGWGFTMNTNTGYVGIGTDSAFVPLTFKDAAGDKLMLGRRLGASGQYGMGIANNGLRFYMPDAENDLLFGKGDNNNFTPMMRLNHEGVLLLGSNNDYKAGLVVDKKQEAVHAMFGSNTTGVAIESSYPGIGFNTYYNLFRRAISTGFGGYIGVNPEDGGMNLYATSSSANTNDHANLVSGISIRPTGNVGIGTGESADYPLDVNGRVRIRHKGGATAGIFFNGSTGSERGFVGLQDDNNIGFYGNGDVGWGLTMNLQNGSLRINGSPGVYGQVLASNGSENRPSWVFAGNMLPSLSYTAYRDCSIPSDPFDRTWTDFAGASASLDLSAGRHRLIFNANIMMQVLDYPSKLYGLADIGILVNGNYLNLVSGVGSPGVARIMVPNNTTTTIGLSGIMVDVGPTSNCTIQWQARNGGVFSPFSLLSILYWSVQVVPID